MINTEWDIQKKQIKEALQFGLLMPLCIAVWTICILATTVLEAVWRIRRWKRK